MERKTVKGSPILKILTIDVKNTRDFSYCFYNVISLFKAFILSHICRGLINSVASGL